MSFNLADSAICASLDKRQCSSSAIAEMCPNHCGKANDRILNFPSY